MSRSRLASLRALLKTEELDALLLSSLPAIRYLTGFSGSYGFCVITRRTGWLITDSRYAEQSRAEVRGVRVLITSETIPRAIAHQFLLRGCRTAGFEADEMPVALYRSLRRALPGISLRPTAGLTELLTVSKDAKEVALIARAAKITERVLGEVLPMIRPGVREREIAAEIVYRHRLHGGGDSFEPIVASGPRSALPHAGTTGRRFRNGDLIILDLGCSVEGYHSDLSRTVAVGRASRRARQLHAVVLEALEAAGSAARPGISARELDGVARRIITGAGHGKAFLHSLGHGLGLRIHERPRISPLSGDLLRPGNVIALEPGIYYPGWGGIRIEDDYHLTARGARPLTHSSRELIICS